MKTIFVCMYLAKNLGDDLFLDTLAKRYPNCKFVINYIHNMYDEFFINYDNVVKCSEKRDYNKISIECDALIYIGGSLFQEVVSSKIIYANRMTIMNQFIKRGKPVFVLGSNFGPYNTDEFYKLNEEMYRKIDDMCFRDKYSYDLFKHIESVRYAPDIAFESLYFKYSKIGTENKIDNELKEIGFSIINLEKREKLKMYQEEYINSMTKSIKLFIDKGYHCRLMSFCENEEDMIAIKYIKQRLEDNYLKNISVYEYKNNIDEAIEIISKFKLFVATRLHANIIGVGLNIPILPVIYNIKITNILKDLELYDIKIEMNNLELLYNEEIIEKAMKNILSQNTLSSRESQFDKLDKYIY